MRFKTRSVRTNTKGSVFRGYEGQIDLFLVFCPETEKVYAVPIEEALDSGLFLRVTPTRNNQAQGIRWASEYELPE